MLLPLHHLIVLKIDVSLGVRGHIIHVLVASIVFVSALLGPQQTNSFWQSALQTLLVLPHVLFQIQLNTLVDVLLLTLEGVLARTAVDAIRNLGASPVEGALTQRVLLPSSLRRMYLERS
jgi:hypothetical protein